MPVSERSDDHRQAATLAAAVCIATSTCFALFAGGVPAQAQEPGDYVLAIHNAADRRVLVNFWCDDAGISSDWREWGPNGTPPYGLNGDVDAPFVLGAFAIPWTMSCWVSAWDSIDDAPLRLDVSVETACEFPHMCNFDESVPPTTLPTPTTRPAPPPTAIPEPDALVSAPEGAGGRPWAPAVGGAVVAGGVVATTIWRRFYR